MNENAKVLSDPKPVFKGGEFKGYSYRINTTKILRERFIKRKFYAGPIWLDEMRRFANPWHAARRPRVELGFKLLAVARGQSLGVVTLDSNEVS